jgi:hypothetical protein
MKYIRPATMTTSLFQRFPHYSFLVLQQAYTHIVLLYNCRYNNFLINKSIILYYVHLLHVSIQLDHHQANINEMYTHIELYY